MDESGDQNTNIDGNNNTVNNIQQSAGEGQIILTEEIYKEILDDKVKIRTFELNAAHGEEKARLQKEIDDLKNLLTNLPQAFEDAQIQIAKLKAKLEREGNEIGAEKLAVAITALEQADFSKADELFAEIEAREELAVKRSARAAYARGEIAHQDVRWSDAAKHFARAAHLDPCFETLIMAQRLADAMGDYNSAFSFGLESAKAAVSQYGDSSEEYAISLNNLGGLYQTHGQYEDAKSFHETALNIYKALFGENHILTSAVINNLGSIYDAIGQYKDAELFLKKALKIRLNILGENHPDTATSLNNLTQFYVEREQYEQAEGLYQRAISIYKKTLGENHPYTSAAINNLAMLYQVQERFEEAELFIKEALKIAENILGKDHPSTAAYLNNLGGIYQKQERHKDAEPIFKHALEILENIYSHDHPEIKTIKRNYERSKKANTENPTPK